MFLESCYTLIWSSGVVCLSTILFNLIRNYASVTVNCWFCNSNFRIPFKSRKEWFCRQCHQFNGFKADGDYSRILPEQFDEALNRNYVKPVFRRNEYVFSSNGLCSICNANQELKIKQLALYVPFKEENYDKEIEIFRNKLEKSYKLCKKCENFVLEKLHLKSNAQQCTITDSIVDEINTIRFSSISEYVVRLRMPVIVIVVIGTLTAFIFKTKLLEKSITDMLMYYDVEQVFLRGVSQFYCDLVLDCIFPLSTLFLPCLFLKSSRSVVAILLVIFSSMITGDLAPFWKIFTISAIMIAIAIRYVANNRVKKRQTPQVSDFNLPHSFDWEDEKDEEGKFQEKVSAAKSNLSTSLYGNAPLCGQFSDMHLDKCEKYVTNLPRQSSPPSFKDRLLIKPSKLKINDLESTDTLRTSPTVSSGYQSLCGGFFKRTSDSDSEFDSISQVHIASANHSFSKISRTHSLLPRFTQQSRFPSADALNLSSAECYYGAIPVYSSTSARLSSSSSPNFSIEKSQLQVDASVPTFQIVLYSITCFVLGFSFQIFVREFFV